MTYYYYYLLLTHIECAVLKCAVHLQNLLNHKVNSQYKNKSFVNIYIYIYIYTYIHTCSIICMYVYTHSNYFLELR